MLESSPQRLTPGKPKNRSGSLRDVRLIGTFLLAIWSVAAFGDSWTKVACPFDSTKALLPVTCGRLTVPENYDHLGRSIEIAVMIVNPAKNIDPEHPVIFLNGGPGGTSLVFAERLVTTPAIRETVVDRDWVFLIKGAPAARLLRFIVRKEKAGLTM